jgi:NitT/TauT family transport system substrate-binding protein
MESLLAARSIGLPIIPIAAVFQKIDVAFIAKRQSGIAKLADFAGRTVSTWYTGVHLILRALLREAGVDLATIIDIPQAESMEPFLRGDVAVAAATFFNQLPQLRARGVTDLTIFDPADHGVIFPRDIIITSEKMAAARPDLVERFLRASLRGWRDVVANQGAAVDTVLRRHATLDRKHQETMLREMVKLMSWGPGTTHGIGYIDPAAVDFAQDFLLRNGQIGKAVTPNHAYTLRFWQPA